MEKLMKGLFLICFDLHNKVELPGKYFSKNKRLTSAERLQAVTVHALIGYENYVRIRVMDGL